MEIQDGKGRLFSFVVIFLLVVAALGTILISSEEGETEGRKEAQDC